MKVEVIRYSLYSLLAICATTIVNDQCATATDSLLWLPQREELRRDYRSNKSPETTPCSTTLTPQALWLRCPSWWRLPPLWTQGVSDTHSPGDI